MLSSGVRADWPRAKQSLRFVYWKKGSRVERTVPLKMIGIHLSTNKSTSRDPSVQFRL